MENNEFVNFLGWKGIYAQFEIKPGVLPNGRTMERIMVTHEGNWIGTDGMGCHSEYEYYEDVQEDLGQGLTFVKKEYSETMNDSFFEYEISDSPRHILAVPATGEEIHFRIYGSDGCYGKYLLVEREL